MIHCHIIFNCILCGLKQQIIPCLWHSRSCFQKWHGQSLCWFWIGWRQSLDTSSMALGPKKKLQFFDKITWVHYYRAVKEEKNKWVMIKIRIFFVNSYYTSNNLNQTVSIVASSRSSYGKSTFYQSLWLLPWI